MQSQGVALGYSWSAPLALGTFARAGAQDTALSVWLTQPISLDFSNLLVHRGGESEKMLCCNNFSWIQERPDADRVYAEAVCI